MSGDDRNLDAILRDILRGAAKILGCGSTTLILINENSHELRIHVGTTADSQSLLGEIERVTGARFSNSFAHPWRKAEDGLAYRAWRERRVIETSSFSDLAGSAFSPLIRRALSGLVGERRFVCVPATSGHRNYGVLVFEKRGRRPFSPQQREVLVRYGRSIAELVESSLLGRGHSLLARGAEPYPGAGLDGELLRLTVGDPAPTIFVDGSGTVTSCNAAAEKTFGWGADLQRQPIETLFRSPEQVRGLLSGPVHDADAPGRRETVTGRRRSGALFRADLTWLPLADDEDQVVGFLLFVREEAEEGTAARTEIAERLASARELAAQIAHEIRNPIVAIGATLESLEREEMGDEPRAIIAALATKIARLDMVLRGYMAGKAAVPSRSDIRVAGVLEDTWRLLDASQRLAGKTVRVEIDPALVVRADFDAMSQVFFNLLLNALEASPPGGTVVCRAIASPLDVAISFADDGPGLLAPATRCFEPFFTTKKDGTGLGLAVCQKLARAHGGVVELQNAPEGGCVATLVIPRSAEAAARGAIA